MAKQKNIITEFRNYPLRVEFPILLLTGNQWWISDVPSANLHFHNCLEIGLCHEGEGTLIIQKESCHFSAGDITIIARNIPHTTYSAPGTQSLWTYLFVDPQELLDLMEGWKASHEAVYDFTADDGIGHRAWVIDGEKEKATIAQQFGEIPSIYIADGHHRAASAVKVGLKRRAEHPDYDGTEEFNYFLSVVFPYDQLTILAYNRVVKDLHGMDEHAFIASLKFNFELMIMPGFPCKPVEKHCMGMYVGGNWYHLKAWDDVYAKKDIVGQLDVSILQEKVLSPILGIGDPRTDQRIRFVGGSHKLSELAQIADSTGGVAFAMFPTAMEDLMQIADESKLMPPKSTWFEPKLRSGLFIHKLS